MIVVLYYFLGSDFYSFPFYINPLNAELNPIRHLLALVGARHIVHISRVRVKVVFISFSFIWVRATIPPFRYDKFISFLLESESTPGP